MTCDFSNLYFELVKKKLVLILGTYFELVQCSVVCDFSDLHFELVQCSAMCDDLP